MSAASPHTIPGVHAVHLADLLLRWDVRPEQLLSGLDITREDLLRADARLTVASVETLVERARSLSGEPALGFHLGLQLKVPAHGMLGFAAMTASTVHEALELAVRFAPTRTDAIGLRLDVSQTQATLVIEEHADFGRARDVVLFALATSIYGIGVALTGALRGVAEFALPRPHYVPRFAHLIGGELRFGQPANVLRFDRAVLERPIVMADAAAQQTVRALCERELEAIAGTRTMADRVRELVVTGDGVKRSLEKVANRLHVSTRTLKRRLAEQGTSYSELLDQQRHLHAVRLVRGGSLTVEEIAHRLGYSDAANFSRAFRRWTGTSPRNFCR